MQFRFAQSGIASFLAMTNENEANKPQSSPNQLTINKEKSSTLLKIRKIVPTFAVLKIRIKL